MVPKPSSRTSLNVFLEKHWFVDAFWSAFGSIVVPFVFHLATTLWGPIGYLWHHFWYHFRSYVLRFLCTLRARRIEHALLLHNITQAQKRSKGIVHKELWRPPLRGIWGSPSLVLEFFCWHWKSIPKFNVFQDAFLSTFWMILCWF